MSGSLTLPANAVPGFSPQPWWPNIQPTSIFLDICEPSDGTQQCWFTGFARNAAGNAAPIINAAGVTLTGSVSGAGTLTSFGATNWSVSPSGRFAFQMKNASTQNWTLTYAGVTSTAWSATGFVSAAGWRPDNLIAPAGVKCLFWFDPQNPTLIGVDDPTVATPHVRQIMNKLNVTQYMTSNGSPAPTWTAGGTSVQTRSLIMNQNPNNTNPWLPNPNWIVAFLNDGGGLNTLITLPNAANLQSTPAFTVVLGAFQNASAGYNNGFLWGNSPGTLNWHQSRHNASNYNIDGRDIPGVTYSSGSSFDVAAGKNVFTHTVDGAGNCACRINGSGAGTGTLTGGSVALAFQYFGLGINNLPPGSGSNLPNGVPFAQFGSLQIYSGLLGGSDITQAEAWVGRSMS